MSSAYREQLTTRLLEQEEERSALVEALLLPVSTSLPPLMLAVLPFAAMIVTSYTKVVVGTDGSESSYRAVDRAARLAADAGATLVIACAYVPADPRSVSQAADQLGETVAVVDAEEAAAHGH